MDAGRVVFVVHAAPTPDPALPPAQWSLDQHALEDCMLLAHALRRFEQPRIVSAPDRYVHQSASVLALRFGSQVHDDPRLVYTPGDPDSHERSPLAVRASAAVEEARAQSPTNTAFVVAQPAIILACIAREGLADPDDFAREFTFPCAWSFAGGDAHLEREFATSIR